VISGEHGIGLEKKKFFNKVTDPTVVNMMKGIKSLFDPNNIMNPGKIWD
jgi:FAD/FMN-containing dehydrogenase